jgi:hypothetical protein
MQMNGATGHDDLLGNKLIHYLVDLDLDPKDFVIFGSGPMLAHGIRKDIHDLDIVARGKALRQVKAHKDSKRMKGTITGNVVWSFLDGRIQFSRQWIYNLWTTDELIDNAEIIADLPFAPLAYVIAYKKRRGWPKDRIDVLDIERRLAMDELLNDTRPLDDRSAEGRPKGYLLVNSPAT